MSIRTFRRGLLFFVIDLAIIIGIFVLQFRTDSTIIEKIGGLQVTLEKIENPETDVVLQNKLIVTYNGLNFFSDEQNSAKIVLDGNTKAQNIILKNWEKRDGQGFTFLFSDGVEVMFDVSGEEEGAALSVYTNLPQEISQIMLPYSFSYNMKVQKDEGNKVILNGKKSVWSFTTNHVQDGFICFAAKDAVAHYAVYDDTKKFSFDSITELALADEALYTKSVDSVKNNLISSFRAVLDENNFTELSAVAYVAAMAEKGRYQQALEEFPSAYKRSEKRTYVSAPYFNNLAKMNITLDDYIKKGNTEIEAAFSTSDISLLTTKDIAARLIIYNKPEAVKAYLETVSTTNFEVCTLEQVCGFVKTYVDFVSYKSDYASILAPAMERCMDRFAFACDYDSVLTLKENDQFISVNQGVDIGQAIMRYGMATNQQTYIKAGRVIVNSYLSEGSSFDLRTLTTLYPVVAYNNWYYPHYTFLNLNSDKLMWAWNCAHDINASEDEETGLTLTIDFPESEIHYVMFKGIPKFSTIYIYNVAFRTDPRFETYNSSGYVYKEDENTLLLKSRHKSQYETVRMIKKTR